MCADNDNDHDGGGNDKNDDIEDEDDDLNEVDNDVLLFLLFPIHSSVSQCFPITCSISVFCNNATHECPGITGLWQLHRIVDSFRRVKCIYFPL